MLVIICGHYLPNTSAKVRKKNDNCKFICKKKQTWQLVLRLIDDNKSRVNLPLPCLSLALALHLLRTFAANGYFPIKGKKVVKYLQNNQARQVAAPDWVDAIA